VNVFAWDPLEEARRLGDRGGPPSEVFVTGETPGVLRRTTRYSLAEDGALIANTTLELAPVPLLDVNVTLSFADPAEPR